MKKLLIVTQKVDLNDDVLGFMHGWITAFAKELDRVTVICLYEGKHELPSNVRVLSLGKERGGSRVGYVATFFRYIWEYRKEYEGVFVHMNQVYVILGGLAWRVMGKYVSLWYAHGHVPPELHLALLFSNRIFTSTQSGFRIASPKKKVVGQGIDTDVFVPKERDPSALFRIVTVGRISPSKDHETLIRALGMLPKGSWELSEIGAPAIASDEIYQEQMKQLARSLQIDQSIVWEGAVSNAKLPDYLGRADLFVNMGMTGSLDKAILEAMSSGLPILTCNEALAEVLGPHTDELMYPKGDAASLSQKIRMVIDMPDADRRSLGRKLREIVIRDHGLSRFTKKIISFFP